MHWAVKFSYRPKLIRVEVCPKCQMKLELGEEVKIRKIHSETVRDTYVCEHIIS